MIAIMILTVHIRYIAVRENILNTTMCVDLVASASLVITTATVHQVNLVVILITNVQQVVLEHGVHMIATVLLKNVVTLIIHVQQATAM